MKTKLFLIVSIFLVSLGSCQKDTIDTPGEYRDIQLDEKSAQIVEADNQFGFEEA